VSEKFFLGFLFGQPEPVRGIDKRLAEIKNDGFDHGRQAFSRVSAAPTAGRSIAPAHFQKRTGEPTADS
jgi:hypothetical protein